MIEPDAILDPSLPRPASDTLPAFWRGVREAYGDEPLIRKDGLTLSYREVDQRSAALARGLLTTGATKGSRIGVLASNSPEWVIAWLAVNRIGAICVCLSTFASTAELAYAVPHADLQILITADRYLRHDYAARLEEAFPSLAAADGAQPLAIAEPPYLRAVWLIGEGRRPWARGAMGELEAIGAGSATFDAAFLAAVEAQVFPADWSVMMYTSGSTAFPKAVVHTHGTMVRKFLFMCRGSGIIPYKQQRGDRVIVTAPFFWIGGFQSVAGAMLFGASVICVDDHSPRALFEAVRDEDATHLSGAEAVLLAARNAGGAEAHQFDRLRPHNTAQMPYFKRNAGEALDRYANSLGMTETFGPHSGHISGKPLPPDVPASVGPVLETMEWKIVDPETGEPVAFGEPGELCVRGDWLMAAMYKKERGEVFDADGFYHTGDQCVLRQDGYLIYHSRISGMIKTSGANVSPEEVELAIRGLPEVLEAAVVGLPDPKLGQMVAAAVVRLPGSTIDEAAVRAQALSKLSSFKAPKRVFFVATEDLPRTPSNKVKKPALVEMIAEMIARETDAPASAAG